MGIAEIVFGIAVLLVSVGITIPLAGAIVTRDEWRVARFCLIAAVILVGCGEVSALLFDKKPFQWRLLTGTLTGLAVFVVLPEGLRWINNRQGLFPAMLGTETKEQSKGTDRLGETVASDEARLFMECTYGGLPIRISGSGVITIHYIGGPMSGKLVTPYDERSNPVLHWEEANGGWAAKCIFTNYSDKTLIDVRLSVDTFTAPAIANETGSGITNSPKMVSSGSENISLGKVDVGVSSSIIVYFKTRDKNFWYLTVTSADAKFVGDDLARKVKFQTNLKEPITLYPDERTWQKPKDD